VSYDGLLQITDHYRFHNNMPLVSIPGQINLCHALRIKLRSVSIPPPQLQPISLSGFTPYNKQPHFSRIAQFSHTCYTSRPSHPIGLTMLIIFWKQYQLWSSMWKFFSSILPIDLSLSLIYKPSANYPVQIQPALNLYRWTRFRNVVF